MLKLKENLSKENEFCFSHYNDPALHFIWNPEIKTLKIVNINNSKEYRDSGNINSAIIRNRIANAGSKVLDIERDLLKRLLEELPSVIDKLPKPEKEEGEEIYEELEIEADYSIQPGGGINKKMGLVYEPISPNEVIYNFNGKKGIAKIEEAKGGYFYITIQGKRFWIIDRPLEEKELIFSLPNPLFVEKWIRGEIKSKTAKQLYDELKYYFMVFQDLGEECYHHIAVLTVFETWFIHLLKSTWFLEIIGEFGGGKTALLEAMATVCRHGYLVPNPSVAFVGRCMERLKITPLFDEFDSVAGTKDSELYQLVRVMQRRGQKYSRISETGRPEIFEVFGVGVFAVHGELEQALGTRNVPIFTEESEDSRVPIINMAKEVLGQRLQNELFIWYMDNIINTNLFDLFDLFDTYTLPYSNPDISSRDVDLPREDIYLQLASSLGEQQIRQISQIKGRSAEIAFLMHQIVKNIGLEMDLKRIFEIREEHLEEMIEIDVPGSLRDFLVKAYKEKKAMKNYRNELGEFMISNKELLESFNIYMRNIGHQQITSKEFQGILRDLGFSRGLGRKKMKIATEEEIEAKEEGKIRLVNIFIPRVARRLGLDYNKLIEEGKPLIEQKTLEEPEEKQQKLVE